MNPNQQFVVQHPLLTYFVLTFMISWGGFLLALGPGGLGTSNWETEGAFLPAVLAMLAGPAISGLALTALLDGTAGLRRLLSRLLQWRVAPVWYAFALLTAPILAVGLLSAFSLTAPVVTAENKAAVVLSGLLAGVTTVLEEIGWTGFAVPRLRRRYDITTTGLIVGVLWGTWHLLQQLFISGTYSAGLPRGLYLALSILSAVAGLTAYRILLVWLYDRTGSLLLTTLMHASLTANTIFIFRPEAAGLAFLAYSWAFTAATWVVVATVALVTGARGRECVEPAGSEPVL